MDSLVVGPCINSSISRLWNTTLLAFRQHGAAGMEVPGFRRHLGELALGVVDRVGEPALQMAPPSFIVASSTSGLVGAQFDGENTSRIWRAENSTMRR